MLLKLLRALNRLRMRRLLARNQADPSAVSYSGWRLPKITSHGRLQLGGNVRFEVGMQPAQMTVADGGTLTVGAGSFFNVGVDIFCARHITIGDGCLIATNVRIFDTSFHSVDEGEPVKTAPVVIGRNVWLGHGCVILPGVTIGDHSVIGANSVVSRSVPARTFAAGAPAAKVRDIVASDGFVRA